MMGCFNIRSSAMALTSKALQLQVEELVKCCPLLCPSLLPRQHGTEELWESAQREGKQQRAAFKQSTAAAGKRIGSCCLCDSAGQPSVSNEGEDDESNVLRFTTYTRLDFTNKSIQYVRAGFACGRCRALRDVPRFLQFAALRLGPSHPDREQLVQELAVHFATLNRVPESLQTNPDALILWLQEIMSRAYAIQVLASNVGGWRTIGPDGQAVDLMQPGSSLSLAQHLLAASNRSSTPKSAAKRASTAASQLLMQQSTARPSAVPSGTSAKKNKRSATAAASAVDDQSNVAEAPAPPLTASTSKKAKRNAAAVDQHVAPLQPMSAATGAAKPTKQGSVKKKGRLGKSLMSQDQPDDLPFEDVEADAPPPDDTDADLGTGTGHEKLKNTLHDQEAHGLAGRAGGLPLVATADSTNLKRHVSGKGRKKLQHQSDTRDAHHKNRPGKGSLQPK